MPALTKGPTEGDILKFDLDKNYTREVVTLLTGTNYKIGSVLGQVTASGKYTLSPATGSTGEETAVAVLLENVDASSADKSGVVLRRGPAIISRADLVFAASVSDDTKKAAKIKQLVSAGIIARTPA